MEKNEALNITNSFLDSRIIDEIVIMRIKTNIFEILIDFSKNEVLLLLLNNAAEDKNIKAIFIYNEPGCYNEQVYDKFLRNVMGKKSLELKTVVPDFCDRQERSIEIRVLNRLIKKVITIQKLVVIGLQDVAVTPVFGASLVADFRYATEDMVFSLAHIKYGLHPSGALPFFLTRNLHHSQAVEILLKGKKISAPKALELGLINKIFSSDDFENKCIEEIKQMTSMTWCTLMNTKRLLNYTRKQLEDYFEYEMKIINL